MKKVIIGLLALLLVGGITFWLYQEKGAKSTIKKEITDFAVSDTAAIDKIFMADEQGNTILLKRQEDHWTVNDKYRARRDGIRILLETIKLVRVKAPVSQPALENVLKDIMGNHTKIEIYQGGDNPVKTYFVGSPNQMHTGTEMLIEGSSRPFFTHIEGHHGFLTTRYFTNENDWRDREIFGYKYGDIAEVSITYPNEPQNSFRIIDQGDHEHFAVYSGSGEQVVENIDNAYIQNYLSNYKMIHYESFEETKSTTFIDSVMQSTPIFTINVKEEDGTERLVHGYRKPLKEGYDPEGNPIDYDLDRLYLYIDSNEFVVGQYAIFDRLTWKAANFKRG